MLSFLWWEILTNVKSYRIKLTYFMYYKIIWKTKIKRMLSEYKAKVSLSSWVFHVHKREFFDTIKKVDFQNLETFSTQYKITSRPA